MTVFATLLLIIISPTETAFKTEQYYYILCVGITGLCWVSKGFYLKKGVNNILLLYIIYMCLSALWSPAEGVGRSVFVKSVVLLFVILQLQFDYTENDFASIKTAFVLQFIVLLGMIILFGETEWDGRLWIMRGANSTDPNSLTSWIIIPVCFIIERLFSEAYKHKVIYFLLLISALLITMMTASRSGIICVCLAIILSILYALRNIIRENLPIAFFISIIMFLLLAITIYYLPDTVISRFSASDLSGLGGRTRIWTKIIEYLKAHPVGLIFGMGEASTMYYFRVVAHNMYIELLFSQGLIGVILIVIFLIKAFMNMSKINPYCSIAFFCIIIMSATLSEFTSRPIMLSFFLSCMNIVPCNKNVIEE